jgi:flagellin
MTSQIRGLDQAARNASDAISLTQTAEGNLSQISSVLQRMREIAVQSASDSNTATDRTSLQSEATSLSAEIDRIANTAQFNGKNLLDGSFGSATFQVGANAGQTLAVSINGSTTTTLGLSGIATSTGTATSTAARTNAGAMTILTTVGGTATTIAASTDDGASYVAGARAGTTSALALANAINAKSADTSVAATAKTEVTSDTVSGSIASSSGDLYINGQNIGAIAAVASVADRVAALVNAINGISGTTGVTAASVSGSTYKLTAADGRNIDVTSNLTTGGTGYNTSGFTVAAATGGVGGTAVTNYGQVTMTAGKAIDVGGTAVNGLADSALVGTTLSISTQANASTAITSLDAAINTVNTQRSTMGIAQTRLDSVISNLRTSSDNVGAARGRIRDTDFAKETASMTRNQVLQQAGVAMLAQANALPNLVLSLLK